MAFAQLVLSICSLVPYNVTCKVDNHIDCRGISERTVAWVNAYYEKLVLIRGQETLIELAL